MEIKKARNPAFHRKVFAFFKFCFDHWAADKTEWEHFDERKQFDTFRKHLTVLAGFCLDFIKKIGGYNGK